MEQDKAAGLVSRRKCGTNGECKGQIVGHGAACGRGYAPLKK